MAGGKTRDLNFDYDNATVVFQSDYEEGICTAKLFNLMSGRRDSFDLIMFMGHNHRFAYQDSLTKMVDFLYLEDNINIHGVYSDAFIYHENELMFQSTNPSMSNNLLDKKIVMNVPFLIRSQAAPKFNEQLTHLYLWDGFLRAIGIADGRRSMIFHMAQPLIDIINQVHIEHNVKPELDIIHGTKH